jgi:hypothetical protein
MTGATERPMPAAAARAEWVEHRFFKYRGCAPDPSNGRVLAARPDLPVDTHFPADRDGHEPQSVRVAREAAALELCLNCPVMVACDRYANSVTPDGRLAQPDGVWGGRLAKERREAFKARRHRVAVAAPDEQLQTTQKHAVLLALAMCPDGSAESVAAAAGVDARTANWQRSRLVTQLNLSKATATRAELLSEAVRRGLLDASLVVADDGTVPAWSPVTVAHAPATPLDAEGARAGQSASSPAGSPEAQSRTAAPARRRRFHAVEGQLALWDPDPSDGLALVHPLFPADRLETAA